MLYLFRNVSSVTPDAKYSPDLENAILIVRIKGDNLVSELQWLYGYRSRFPNRRLGSILKWVDALGSVSVNHSLTTPRCKNGTSKC